MLALIVGAVAAIAGILIGFFLRGGSARTEKARLEARSSELDRNLTDARTALAAAQAESAARAGFEALAGEREKMVGQLTAERDKLREEMKAKIDSGQALGLLETAKRALSDQFRVLAAEILEKKSQSFSESSQKDLGNLLNPLKTQIEDFRKKVEEAQIDSKTGVATLQGLIGGLSNLNQQLTEEAHNLTTALRGSAKAQGDWGEFILRDLLEKAGLREGEQFSFQQSFSGIETGDGERTKTARTDVIISLPGGRSLVVDSKLSLNAYTDYVQAADDAARSAALKLHLVSVRGHVVALSKAGYHHLPGLETPDFVVMFVPVEPAFLLALQNDAPLWADAYQQGILLVGPTTLLYIIRIVNVLWQQEAQARNVREVMDRGAKLYEKFVGFVTDMEAIGKGLRDATRSYEDARSKLASGPGNLVKQVEMLRQLGVNPRRSLSGKLLETAELETPDLALAPEAVGAAEDTR